MASPDDVQKHLADPEFQRLEQEALKAQRALDVAVAEIRTKFPLPKNTYWCMFTNRIRPMPLPGEDE
jgi:hypothetical protein